MALANRLFTIALFFSINCSVLTSFSLTSVALSGFALTYEEASASSQWLKLYQYKKSKFSNSYSSDIRSDRFFFSKNGPHSPYDELIAAIEAYSNPSKKFGTQNLEAACVFPARKLILEKLLNIKFADINCTHLNDWVKAVDANQINIVFAGAYGGNPASALGHTFLRFYNKEKELQNLAGHDLLSYAVGFMALPSNQDIRPLYMIKGLTGGYPGFYEIEPHYLKVGLYNNAESRDLWEWNLRLNKDEVDLLLLHLWELTFNAEFKYFFIGENCSYRLITMIELVRPNLKLVDSLPIVVLPSETIRLLSNYNLLHQPPQYRSSIGRRIQLKLSSLNSDQMKAFKHGKINQTALNKIKDPAVLDLLIDHWTYENYRLRTKLSSKQKELMNLTFLAMAESKSTLPEKLEDDKILRDLRLLPLTQSHEPSWFALSAINEKARTHLKLTYRLGAHAMWQDSRGFDNVSWIEYLGLDYEFINQTEDLWNAVILKAYSLESILSYANPWSWQFEAGFSNRCAFCNSPIPHLYVSGGGGFTLTLSNFQTFLLAHLKSQTWIASDPESFLAPGYLAGIQWRHSQANILVQHQQHWYKKLSDIETSVRGTFYLSSQIELFTEFKHLSAQFSSRTNYGEIGFVRFF